MRTNKAVQFIYIAGKKFKILQEGKRKYIQIPLKYAKNLEKIHNVKDTAKRSSNTPTSAYEKILLKRVELTNKMYRYNSDLNNSIQIKTFMYFFHIYSDYLIDIAQVYTEILNLIIENIDNSKLETYLNAVIKFINTQVRTIISNIPNNDMKMNEKVVLSFKKEFNKLIKSMLSYLNKLSPVIEKLKPEFS